MYFDPAGPPPREAITAEEANEILELATSRLGLSRAETWVDPDDDLVDDIAWFLEATTDPTTRDRVMTGGSMRKLAELGTTAEWIRWLRREFEKADRTARELTERELARPRPASSEELDPKWRLKCRLESDSHSIRARPLAWWNDLSTWIRLHAVTGKPEQLIVEMDLPKAVSVHSLWWMGLGAVQQFLVALNIGSAGFFWFHMPEKVARFYEELVDLESQTALVLQRSPALRIAWGHNVLSDEVLRRVSLCVGALPGREDTLHHVPFNHYLAGLGFLAKTDVILPFERNAFEQFYRALREADGVYGSSDRSFAEQIESFAPKNSDSGERDALLSAGALVEQGRAGEAEVDLSQVATLKVLTDLFFLEQFDRRMRL